VTGEIKENAAPGASTGARQSVGKLNSSEDLGRGAAGCYDIAMIGTDRDAIHSISRVLQPRGGAAKAPQER